MSAFRSFTLLLAVSGFLCGVEHTLSQEVTSCPGGADKEMRNRYRANSEEACQSTNQNKSSQGNFRVDPRFEGVYTFPVDPVPRMNCSDEAAMDRIEKGGFLCIKEIGSSKSRLDLLTMQAYPLLRLFVLALKKKLLPVILTQCSFASSTQKWNVDYLVENLRDEGHGMHISPSRQFLYYSNELTKREYKNWTPPTQSLYVYFHEFVDIAKELKKANNGSRAYFMSVLYMDEEGLSASLTEDVNSMDYQWLIDMVTKFGWGMEVTNMLIVGMTDVVTPAHIDILENFFVQISGYKRCILFSPEYFHSLYPYPVGHPHDRQTQVDFDDPDFEKFPRFKDIRGVEAVVGPGDVLYIPQYWWHHIESEKNNMTVSLNFWFDPANKTDDNATSETKTEEETSATAQDDLKAKSNDTDKSVKDTSEINKNESQTSSTNSTEVNYVEGMDREDQPGTPSESEEQERPGKRGIKKKQNENSAKEDEPVPSPLSPIEQLAFLREVEMKIFKATMDHGKVKRVLEELLEGRFNFLDKK